MPGAFALAMSGFTLIVSSASRYFSSACCLSAHFIRNRFKDYYHKDYNDSGHLWTVPGLLVVELELSMSWLEYLYNGFHDFLILAFLRFHRDKKSLPKNDMCCNMLA